MDISNEDILWTGNHDGYSPMLRAGLSHETLVGAIGIGALVERLLDPEKFVAAHVLLTNAMTKSFSVFPDWNGLQVSIEADGTVRIDPEQRYRLFERWSMAVRAAAGDRDGGQPS